ncbi:type IIL restriction-modification enzyme MmeI, partial [Corynebacterium durum]|uniref:type IIL restriction-modification enzyme MmeI n=1 Tax=Corynebacterium durum TaxID=61592 RepID=UPI00389A7FD9
MNLKTEKAAAKAFVKRWHGRGYEKGDTHSFWLDLLQNVVGMDDVTTRCRFEQPTSKHGYIDVVIRDAKTIVEQKSSGISLDKPELRQGRKVTPFEQAKAYADSLPNSQRPDFIIVCNFDTFRIHSLEKINPERDYLEFSLSELPTQAHLLNFLIDPRYSRLEKEREISLEAGILIGKLHKALGQQYIDPESEISQHSLNVLCVRLVFCLFAEDAGIFMKDSFGNFLQNYPANQLRRALLDLFTVLNQDIPDRDPYLSDDLQQFPYVNGGLFTEEVEIPNFTEDIRNLLVDEVSQGTDWSGISPTIFGGVFESTLNPETRRSGGMHYTSIENIHKVIDPLFLDQLKKELTEILGNKKSKAAIRRRKLERFQEKLASLTFLDPACGSGNFLTETYISLRQLENQVISEIFDEQTILGFDNIPQIVKVSLQQFHGIEINDFAVSVAKTALW